MAGYEIDADKAAGKCVVYDRTGTPLTVKGTNLSLKISEAGALIISTNEQIAFVFSPGLWLTVNHSPGH